MSLDLTQIQPFHSGLFYDQEPESNPQVTAVPLKKPRLSERSEESPAKWHILN